MISFCVFRRYGLSVPLTVLAVGYLMEWLVDRSHESGYYSSHFWPLGVSLLVSGIIVGLVSCVLSSPTNTNGVGSSTTYSSLLVDSGNGDYDATSKLKEIGSDVQERLEHFVFEDNSDNDMFCYVPLNRCALALMGLGIGFMVMELFA